MQYYIHSETHTCTTSTDVDYEQVEYRRELFPGLKMRTSLLIRTLSTVPATWRCTPEMKTPLFNQDTVHGLTYIEMCTKLPLNTSFNQNTVHSPSYIEMDTKRPPRYVQVRHNLSVPPMGYIVTMDEHTCINIHIHVHAYTRTQVHVRRCTPVNHIKGKGSQ